MTDQRIRELSALVDRARSDLAIIAEVLRDEARLNRSAEVEALNAETRANRNPLEVPTVATPRRFGVAFEVGFAVYNAGRWRREGLAFTPSDEDLDSIRDVWVGYDRVEGEIDGRAYRIVGLGPADRITSSTP